MEESRLVEELAKASLTRRILVGLKIRALRRRAWYTVLDRMERGLVDLTIQWVDKVRNGTLTKVLLRILEKLMLALEQGLARVLAVGRLLAVRSSKLAVRWGYNQAYAWRFDESLWRGLGALASHPGVRRIP